MESKTIQYRLVNIDVSEFFLSNPKNKFSTKESNLVGYDFSANIAYNLELDHLIMSIGVRAKINETDEFIMNSIISFVYHVKNLSDSIKTDGKTKSIENKILELFLSISISTTRGIIFEKTRGSILQAEIIPIVNPQHLLTNFQKSMESNKK